MRRGGAGDGARASRRMDSAGATPRRLRRLARRQQGKQHRQGRAHLWLRRQGFSQRAHDAARLADALHHPLEFQPFRGAGRHRWRRRLHQRSRGRTPAHRHGRARPRLHRRGAHDGTDRRIPAIGHQATGIEAAAARVTLIEGPRRPAGARKPGACGARDRRRRLFKDLHRQHPDPADRQLVHSAADRHGPDRAGSRTANAGAPIAAAEAADQAFGRDGQPFSLARHGASGRILHPAPCRRYFQPRRRQRTDRAPAFERGRIQCAQSDIDRVLCRRHGHLRSSADDHWREHDAFERAGAEIHQRAP